MERKAIDYQIQSSKTYRTKPASPKTNKFSKKICSPEFDTFMDNFKLDLNKLNNLTIMKDNLLSPS